MECTKAVIALLVLGLVACVPPTRLGIGGGGAAGRIGIRNTDDQRVDRAVAAMPQIRLAVTPRQLDRFAKNIRTDVSIGWNFDWKSAGAGRSDSHFRHGPFFELVRFIPSERFEGTNWRWGPSAAVETIFAPADEVAGSDVGDLFVGMGAAGGVLFENVAKVRRRGVLGDFAMGVAGRLGVRHSDGGAHVYALVTFELRLPSVFLIPTPGPSGL